SSVTAIFSLSLHDALPIYLTRGSGVSSKLRMTAAVSSASLNWGIVTVLWITIAGGTLHQRCDRVKHAAIGTQPAFALSRPIPTRSEEHTSELQPRAVHVGR